METQITKICPACKTQSLIVTNRACSCVICGYYDDQQFQQNKQPKKILQRTKKEEKLFKMNQIAQKYFASRLEKSAKAMSYLQKRGFDTDTFEIYGFGYDDGQLQTVLKSFGYIDADIEEAGLAKYEKDFFFHRLTIPIRDNAKRIIGFGARTLEDDICKYINTPETEIFHKKSVFFGIDKLDFTKDIILCEGFFDVLTMQKNGFNVLATMGTALTLQHALLLKELNKNLYLLYDSDSAGKTATIKNLKLLQSKQIPCKWVDLNPHKDPDEFLQNIGKRELQNRILNAKERKLAVMEAYDTVQIHEIINYLYEATLRNRDQ